MSPVIAAALTTTLLQKMGAIGNFLKKAVGYTRKLQPVSLIDATKLARVEPLTVVSKDCLPLDYLPDVLQSLLSIFSGYYLQAVALTAQVKNVKVIKVLDSLSVDHPGVLATLGGQVVNTLSQESFDNLRNLSLESYQYKLPMSTDTVIALEASAASFLADRYLGKADDYVNAAQRKVESLEKELLKEKIKTDKQGNFIGRPASVEAELLKAQDELTKARGVAGGRAQYAAQFKNEDPSVKLDLKTVTDLSNLAVGKLLDVEVCIDDNTMKVPVRVNLAPVSISTQSILHILALSTEDNSFSERYHAWRAGRITFINDLILCQDMISEHKQALMHDGSGVYSEIVRRANNAKKHGLIAGTPSLATASNLFVISETVAAELESKLGGKLHNPRIRAKAFENTYAMIIVVIDREWERVTFYHRGIAAATEVSVKDIRANAKGKGPDIMDVFKAYNMGSSPTF